MYYRFRIPRRTREQSVLEEVANSITHGIGALMAVAALSVGVAYSATEPYCNAWNVVSMSIYGFTMVNLYTSSCMYHSISHPATKSIFNYFDYCSIYLFIAGSYTPICLGALRVDHPGWAWSIFGVEWGMCILGMVYQCVFMGRNQMLSNASYIVMGWAAMLILYPMFQSMGLVPVSLLIAGDLLYTLGILFYASRNRRYMHALWHLFVMLGSAVQFYMIFRYIVLK